MGVKRMRPDLSLRPAGVGILLLVADRNMRKFLLYFLKNQRVTVASSPAKAKAFLETRSFGLAILTNFGIPPREALSVVPERRDYAVLFLTGYMDKTVQDICSRKKIPWRRVPMETSRLQRELRLALRRSRARRGRR